MNYNSTCGCNNQVTCLPSSQDCGVNVTLTSSNTVARVCQEVTYTVTITNNAIDTMWNTCLTLPIDNALALMQGTVTINGVPYNCDTMDLVPLGDINPGETVTVTYVVTVMQNQRYIKHKAKVRFCCCQCFNKKPLCVLSNCNVLQVCPCCGCGCGNNFN